MRRILEARRITLEADLVQHNRDTVKYIRIFDSSE